MKSSYQQLIIMDEVKMFLFARWIATCYADSHLDGKMRCEHDEGFKQSEAISVLNRETGYWYKEQLKHFNDVVYPNYVKNGTVDSTRQFFDTEGSLLSDEEIREAADEWVFDKNGMKWSNNDDTAGDNYGSFMAGANWALSRLNNDL